MSTVTAWHRTNAFTEPDPADDYYQRDHTKKPKPAPRAKISALSITLNIEANPNNLSEKLGGSTVLKDIKEKLILQLYEKWQNKEAVGRALGISVRTVWTVIDAKKEQELQKA